jgi:hypothetical protein
MAKTKEPITVMQMDRIKELTMVIIMELTLELIMETIMV